MMLRAMSVADAEQAQQVQAGEQRRQHNLMRKPSMLYRHLHYFYYLPQTDWNPATWLDAYSHSIVPGGFEVMS